MHDAPPAGIPQLLDCRDLRDPVKRAAFLDFFGFDKPTVHRGPDGRNTYLFRAPVQVRGRARSHRNQHSGRAPRAATNARSKGSKRQTPCGKSSADSSDPDEPEPPGLAASAAGGKGQPEQRTCQALDCSHPFTGKGDKEYCGNSCRVREERRRKALAALLEEVGEEEREAQAARELRNSIRRDAEWCMTNNGCSSRPTPQGEEGPRVAGLRTRTVAAGVRLPKEVRPCRQCGAYLRKGNLGARCGPCLEGAPPPQPATQGSSHRRVYPPTRQGMIVPGWERPERRLATVINPEMRRAA